jgi:hypothetical protein
MNPLTAFWKRRALKRYAQELPRRLSRDFGAREFFTPAQIKATVDRLKLDAALIAYGYAMFLPEEMFNELLRQMPDAISYEQARAAVRRFIPSSTSSGGGFYESGEGLGDGIAGGDSH